MKRIRKLGLGAAMALTVLAIAGAASASATTKFAAEVGSGEFASIKAEHTGSLLFSVSGLLVDCGSPSLWSPTEIKGSTKVSPISASTAVGKITCKASGGASSLDPKSCFFTFSPGNNGGNGTLGIGPEGCGAMVLTAAACEFSLAPQSTPVKPLTVSGSPSTVSVETSGATALSATAKSGCPKGSFAVSTQWRLKAYNAGGAQAGLFLTAKNGVFFNSGAKLFEAEEYPVSVSGENSTEHLLTLIKGQSAVKCEYAAFTSREPLAGASSTLSLDAVYEGCWRSILTVKWFTTIDMNSCYFDLVAAGTAAVACTVEGDRVEVNVWQTTKPEETKLLCGYKIAPQSVGTVTYETVGVGYDRVMPVNLNLTGIKSTREGGSGGEPTCGPNEGSTGTYTGTVTLGA